MTTQETAKILANLLTVWSNEAIDADKLTAYQWSLADVDYADVEYAVKLYLRRGTFFPKPAELLSIIAGTNRLLYAGAAWELVQRQINRARRQRTEPNGYRLRGSRHRRSRARRGLETALPRGKRNTSCRSSIGCSPPCRSASAAPCRTAPTAPPGGDSSRCRSARVVTTSLSPLPKAKWTDSDRQGSPARRRSHRRRVRLRHRWPRPEIDPGERRLRRRARPGFRRLRSAHPHRAQRRARLGVRASSGAVAPSPAPSPRRSPAFAVGAIGSGAVTTRCRFPIGGSHDRHRPPPLHG